MNGPFPRCFFTGGNIGGRARGTKRLVSDIPFRLYVFDLGGGLCEGKGGLDEINISMVCSAPLLAFWEGLTHPDIRWGGPNHFDWRSFGDAVSAGGMEEMEKALAWLDEAIYLDKKVLVHCRHGIGRTGTFVTAYLIRKGLGLKLATKKLEITHTTPSNYEQWRLLRKYGKKPANSGSGSHRWRINTLWIFPSFLRNMRQLSMKTIRT